MFNGECNSCYFCSLYIIHSNHVHNFSHRKFEDFVTVCYQVMSGILVILMGLNDPMWTALGALLLGYPNQRFGLIHYITNWCIWNCNFCYVTFSSITCCMWRHSVCSQVVMVGVVLF